MKKITALFILTSAIIIASCSKPDNDAPSGPQVPIYVAGYIQGVSSSATLWKIVGNTVTTTPLTDGNQNSTANSVFVSGNDVYVAGYRSSGEKDTAKVWKNGVAVNLTNGNQSGKANRVFVSGSNVY